MASRSKRSGRHASATSCTASAGIRPTRACARASARSAWSIASSHARSDTASRIASGTKIASKGKEHRLVLALQVYVETHDAVVLRREQPGEERLVRLRQVDAGD